MFRTVIEYRYYTAQSAEKRNRKFEEFNLIPRAKDHVERAFKRGLWVVRGNEHQFIPPKDIVGGKVIDTRG